MGVDAILSGIDVQRSVSRGNIPAMATGSQRCCLLSEVAVAVDARRTAVRAGVHFINEPNAHSTVDRKFSPTTSPPSNLLSPFLFQTIPPPLPSNEFLPSKTTLSALALSTSNLVIPFNKTLPAANTPNKSILLRLASYNIASSPSGKDRSRLSKRIKMPMDPRRREVRSEVRFRRRESIGVRLARFLLDALLLLRLLLLNCTVALLVERKDD
mmetsp:Transcript_17923/g.38683  ORF Transcript_17923/g.38683 Transcript_17923/m.38683 type:complete len:213 (+) Transcript_17923:562-1200(+)